jgi:hypothetical protein
MTLANGGDISYIPGFKPLSTFLLPEAELPANRSGQADDQGGKRPTRPGGTPKWAMPISRQQVTKEEAQFEKGYEYFLPGGKE